MTAAQKRVDGSIDTIKGLTDSIVILTGERIDQANGAFDFHCRTLELTVKLRIARVESALMGPITILGQSASYHTLRAYWQASPALIAILAAIWGVIVAVYNVVKWVVSIYQIVLSLGLDDLLAEHWEWFAEARDKFRKWVTQLSETLGWGVDGFLHLLHACQGVTSVVGGLTGKDYKWMQAAWIDKTGDVLGKVDELAAVIEKNPGAVMEMIFQFESYDDILGVKSWGAKLNANLFKALEKGKSALEGLSGVAGELAAIQEGMPDVVRENIPAAIWDGIETFGNIIDEELLPRLRTAERYLETINSLIDQHAARMGDLADKLAHPGTNLLGIDDLPDYARISEEFAIDEVSSRLFGEGAETDRADIQADLDRFEIIDAAARSPLPALEFMEIETPGRGALHGIVVEAQETWFIGGYNSQL